MANLLEGLEDFITCEVCLSRFEGRDPRSLRCLHAFCLQCLKDVHTAAIKRNPANNKDVIKCPKCQDLCPIQTSIDAFPKYFQASQVADILGKADRQSGLIRPATKTKGYETCSVCAEDASVTKPCCFTCKETLCGICEKKHDGNSGFANHVKVAVTAASVVSLVCQDHAELVAAFCIVCSKSVCRRCQITTHAGHHDSEFAVRSEKEDRLRLMIAKRLKDLESARDTTKEQLAAYKQHVTKVRKEMEELRSNLIGQIDSQIKAMHKELEDKEASVSTALDSELSELTTRSDRLAELDSKYLNPEPTVPHLALKDIPDLPSPKHCPSKATSLTSYEFITERSDIMVGFLKETSVPINHAPDDANDPNLETSGGQIQRSSTLPKPATADGSGTKSQAKSRRSESASLPQSPTKTPAATNCRLIWSPQNGQWFKSVGFLQNHILALTSWKLEFINWTSKTSDSLPFAVPDYVDPISLMAVDRWTGAVAVVYPTPDRQFRVMMLTSDRLNAQFTLDDPPATLAFDASGTLLIGTGSNCALLNYTQFGRRLWKKVFPHECLNVSVDSQNNFIVCDGQHCHVYGRGLGEADHVTLPRVSGARCAASDNRDNIYVVDDSRKLIEVFTPKGDFVRVAGSFRGRVDSLAIYRDRLMVLGTWYDGLYLYELTPPSEKTK